MSSTPEKPRLPDPDRTARTDPTWYSPDGEAPPLRPGALGWLMLAWRLPLLAIWVFGGLAIHLTIRLVEHPLAKPRRPVTPWITQAVCKGALRILGIKLVVMGQPMRERGAVVSNHVSWLDIFVLNAPQRIYFVSKAEVANWPGIGWLARATGTVFINRDPREARAQKELFETRLRAGHHLCFFPEGTSSDGVRVLTFKPTLFAAFFAPEMADFLHIQTVSLVYHAPAGRDARFYGWWGDQSFGAHFLSVVSQPRQGAVEVIFHPPVRVRDAGDRKALARAAEARVRADLARRLPPGVAQP